MPLNILEGLNFDFDIRFHSLPEQNQKSFLEFHERFFPFLENYAQTTHEQFFKLLRRAKLKDKPERSSRTPEWSSTGRNLYDLRYLKRAGLDLPDDFTLLRFLTSDQFNIDLALKRTSDCLIWRFKERINQLQSQGLPDNWEKYRSNRIYRVIGNSKNGTPIIAERFGETLGVNNLLVMNINKWIQNIVYETELLVLNLRSQSEAHNRPIEKIIMIYDMENIKYWMGMKNMSFLKKLDATLSCYYPELVDRILVVNAPSFVSFIFNKVVKRFLDPVTAEKVIIRSSIYEVRKEKIKVGRKLRGIKTLRTFLSTKFSRRSEAGPVTAAENIEDKPKKKKKFRVKFLSRYKYKKIKKNIFEEFCDIRELPECYGGENAFGSEYPHRVGFSSTKNTGQSNVEEESIGPRSNSLYTYGSAFSTIRSRLSSVYSASRSSLGRKRNRTLRQPVPVVTSSATLPMVSNEQNLDTSVSFENEFTFKASNPILLDKVKERESIESIGSSQRGRKSISAKSTPESKFPNWGDERKVTRSLTDVREDLSSKKDV
eukprot:augustus_masked-scaffold_4-processed-gene-3.61-mRNA-1 protein AED:1.00 eAED:1.00 QI:0/-1/0/0/-1/1/1/0/542